MARVRRTVEFCSVFLTWNAFNEKNIPRSNIQEQLCPIREGRVFRHCGFLHNIRQSHRNNLNQSRVPYSFKILAENVND